MAVKKKPGETQASNVLYEIGKMPPQAGELEEIVLGAIMIEKDALFDVVEFLKPESFYNEAHSKIYKAILDLSADLKPIDIMTVTDILRSKKQLDEVGGPYYITQLTTRVGSAAHIEYHARIIAQKYIQRELIRTASEIQKRAYEDSEDVADLIDFSERELFKIAEGNIKRDVQEISKVIKESLKEIEIASQREDGLSGVPSGFTAIDRITQGWQKSDMIIIAARPSMGKTAFVLSMARNIAVVHKKPVVVFSLEMAAKQLTSRLIAAESELPADKLRSGKLADYEWQQLEYRIKSLIDAPIFIDDTPQLSIYELRAKCRRLKLQHDVQLIIVDYLQLMTTGQEKNQSREQEVSTISRSLKAIAKELDVPVIALSQLNRMVEQRQGQKGRPQLSDLRESGAIEQDADVVCFIHRPERYGVLEDENGNSMIGIAEIIIAKHRNGAVGDVKLRFRNELAQFADLDTDVFMSGDNKAGPVILGSKMNQDAGEDSAQVKIRSNVAFESTTDAPF